MNDIEHLWEHLDRHIRKHEIKGKDDLKKALMEEWGKIPTSVTQNLVNSMPSRLKAVKKNKGFPTKKFIITVKFVPLFGNMDPRALILLLQSAVHSTSRCSGVSGSMSQNRQIAEETKLMLNRCLLSLQWPV